MAVATVGAPQRRVVDPPLDRPVQRPIPAEEAANPLAPARGILIAAGVGAMGWALLIAAFLLGR
jgi:hypothetical protein